MVERLEALFAERPPAAVLVQGDTNTASAAAQAGNYAVPRRHALSLQDGRANERITSAVRSHLR